MVIAVSPRELKKTESYSSSIIISHELVNQQSLQQSLHKRYVEIRIHVLFVASSTNCKFIVQSRTLSHGVYSNSCSACLQCISYHNRLGFTKWTVIATNTILCDMCSLVPGCNVKNMGTPMYVARHMFQSLMYPQCIHVHRIALFTCTHCTYLHIIIICYTIDDNFIHNLCYSHNTFVVIQMCTILYGETYYCS